MLAKPKEIVYINNGEIYKSPSDPVLAENYSPDDFADPIFPFVKVDGKKYLFTTEFKSFFGDTTSGTSLANLDLCPDVALWICLGAKTPEETQNFDIFFTADSSAQLRKVAEYYNLPYPCTQEIDSVLDTTPEDLCFWNVGGKPVVPGGVKFIDGVPSILKLYTYPKPHKSWDIWMYGMSWYDHGKCYESGAVYEKWTGGIDVPGAQMRGQLSFRKAQIIQSAREDGVITRYSFIQNTDPGIFWQGNELDAEGNVARIKRYESTQFVRIMIGKMAAGPTLQDRDLCPSVKFWVGRSWYDNTDTEELLFAVTEGSALLDAVAEYYNLPIPYSPEQKTILDTSPEVYRARHYDFLGLGEGKMLPGVIASVTFKNGSPERLLLYTFLRQWEFKDQIELPLDTNFNA